MTDWEMHPTQRPTSSSDSKASVIDHLRYVAERAKLLFGCYRRNDANDPETYVFAVSAVLADFDDEVIERVTDPRTGIPRDLAFPPNPAEVAEACKRAVNIIEGERLISERETQGYRWIDDPADDKVGFYDSQGQRWKDRHKQLAGTKQLQITMEKRAYLDGAIAAALPHVDSPHYSQLLTTEDGNHAKRIAADLERRRQVNANRASVRGIEISES